MDIAIAWASGAGSVAAQVDATVASLPGAIGGGDRVWLGLDDALRTGLVRQARHHERDL